MPFVQIYADRRLDAGTRKAISLSIHESLTESFHIPADDYFQVFHEIGPTDLFFPSSYLGVPHSGRIVYIHITAKGGRTVEMKQSLYRGIADKIAARTGVSTDDVVIVLVENGVEDWSFGRGVAQMVEGAATAAGISGASGVAGAGTASVGRRVLKTVELGMVTLTGFQVHEITLGPGMKVPLHFHPCPVTGIILRGTAFVQVEGEEAQIIPAGESFYEPAMKRILHFDNYSATEPMVFSAFYLVHGDHSLIEMIKE